MKDYRAILRLKNQGYSHRETAERTSCSKNTVIAVCKLAASHRLEWPLPEEMTNGAIHRLFYPERTIDSGRQAPDYEKIHEELAKANVTLTLLHNEYCEACYSEHTIPYQYTQFCDGYRKWANKTKATMRISRKPGDVMEVDWAGSTLPVYDSVTGETEPAFLFVAVLPCSLYAYVEAFPDMKLLNWITAHIHAYRFFGGVTRLLVPDNLKTGVISNTRYETVLNKSYNEMAEHYGTAVVPTRVRRPQDKGHVEGTVKQVSTWIIAALRNEKFFNIRELNEIVFERLSDFNRKPFKQHEGCRLTAFENEEKAYLLPLPTKPYEPAVWSTAIVRRDYLISDGKNRYSVPFNLIGEEVDIRLTVSAVEIFYHGDKIASHMRLSEKQRDPIIIETHMPENHRRYMSYSAESYRAQAEGIGDNTLAVVNKFLNAGSAPEQGFKACTSLLNLADRYGNEQIESACRKAIAFATEPSIKIIITLLKNAAARDDAAPSKTSNPGAEYGHARGAGYFGGDASC